MRATLKQVAEHSNLSIPTVSEILNNKNRMYRDETRMRVFEVARQLGYRPNGSARSMKSGRFGAVALLQSSHERRSYLPHSLLKSIGDHLSLQNLLLTLASVTDEQLIDQTFTPQILRILAVDGLLVNYNAGFPERLMALIRSHRIPSIWINSKPGEDCLYPDDISAARVATEHLIGLGHRKIAFVDYNYGYHNDVPVHYSNYDRYFGYGQAMQRAGLGQWEIRADATLAMDARGEFSARWLSAATRPTAVLAYSWETALPVVATARAVGLRVPEDLSVITFNDHVTDELGSFIDTMVLPETEMGRQAVDLLLEKIEDPQKVFPSQAIALDFQKGWTTAAAPETIHGVIRQAKGSARQKRAKSSTSLA